MDGSSKPETTAPGRIIDWGNGPRDLEAVAEEIRERGYAVLRNAFPTECLERMFASRDWWFRAPAAGGAPGYCKFDYEKRVVQTSLLGRDSLRILLDEDILDLIERYTGHEVVLSESFTKLDRSVDYVYFPPHSDYMPDYRPSSHFDKIRATAEDMKHPLGLSYVLYHHDTTAGAFCYCAGSHKLGAHRGCQVTDYPEDERRAIMSTWTRLDGRKGDIVVFDPRGFHGQDQPSAANRYVTISRFWRTDIFGYHQARPLPVYTMDLAGLSERQLSVLGIGAQSLTPLEFDHHAGFKKRRRAYAIVTKLIEHAYDLDYAKKRLQPLRSRLRRLLRPGTGAKVLPPAAPVEGKRGG